MTIDAQAIQQAVLSLGLVGDPQSGILRRFGVILASNSVDFLIGREMNFITGLGDKAVNLAERVLIDAAQWCANATFSGIMASEEWAKMIAPHVDNKADRLEGLIAVTNCLGWGKISEYQLDEANQELSLTVEHSYYVEPWVKKYGAPDRPICYMWTGVAGGYMDLLFDEKVNTFKGEEVLCKAKGDPNCIFKAKKMKKKFGLG